MSNSLLSGFTDADSEDDEILEMSSDLFPVNPLYQSGSFPPSSLLPTSPPQQITPTTLPVLPQTVPSISPIITTPLMSPIATLPLQTTPQAFSSLPITPTLAAQPLRTIPVQPVQANLQQLQAQQLQAQLAQTQQLQTQIQAQTLQTQQLQQQIQTQQLQQTQGQTQIQTGQIQVQGQTQAQQAQQAQVQAQAQGLAKTALTLPQLKQAQAQIIYRLQQLKQLIGQAQLQKNDPSATTTTTSGQPTTDQSTTGQSTTSVSPATPIPLVSAGPNKPSVPLHTMLPQLIQQQQALVQKYHQTQQQIQLLSGGAPGKTTPSPTSTTVPPVINTQKQIALVYQKLQEVQQQIQAATKLAPASSTPLSPNTPSTNPTVLALQKQQQLLARQYQQLLQLQSKTPPPPSPNSSAPLTVTPLSSSLTIPTTSIAPSLPSNGIPTSPTATISPFPILQTNAALQTTSLAPSLLSTTRIESSVSNGTNSSLSSSTAASSLSSSSSSVSADVVWSLHDQARLQRALVKFGTNFSVLSTAMGSKTSSQVRKFYHQSGGAKGSYRFYLAEHHRLKKNEGVLDAYSLELTAEEEELVKQGKLPEMNPLATSQTLASSSSSFAPLLPPPPPSATSELTPPDIFDGTAPPPDKDPLEGMDDVQKKEYKRKRAEQIFAANDRGIFQTNEEGETEVHSPKKARRPLKGTPQGNRDNTTLPPRSNSAKSLVYKKIDPGQ